MKLIEGLIDYSTRWTLPDVYMFTGNKFITKDGRLVMGRGAAKQVRDTYPGIDQHIRIDKPVTFTYIRGEQYLGYFCVKDHFRESADIDLIGQSVTALVTHALAVPHVTFHLNYPGIGAGRLSESAVQPILERLPANVWVYR